MTELVKRLDRYNLHYGFLEDSADFSFEVHPERIIIRNDALRNDDRALYEDYLVRKFPLRAAEALRNFDASVAGLHKLTRTEAVAVFESKQVNLLRSDISARENEAIFTAMIVPLDELPATPEDTGEKLIHNNVHPGDILDRPYIWVDTSLLA